MNLIGLEGLLNTIDLRYKAVTGFEKDPEGVGEYMIWMLGSRFRGGKFRNRSQMNILETYTPPLKKLTKDEFDALPSSGKIDPNSVRYAQETAGYHYKNSEYGNIDDLVKKLNSNNNIELDEPMSIVYYEKGLYPDLDKIMVKNTGDVLEPGVYTLSHRRLIAYQKVNMLISYTKLDKIPYQDFFKFTNKQNGMSIKIIEHE